MKNIFKKLLVALLVAFAPLSVINLLRAHKSEVTALAASPTSGASFYTDPTLYYQGISDNLVGEDLMVALSSLTSSGFVSQSYGSLPNIYRYSDVSLTNPSKMRLIYTGTEVTFSAGSMPSDTNKEQVWPASWYGDGKRNEALGTPGADAHNIWPIAEDLNSKRGSAAFDELNFATSYKAYELNRTDWSYGTPGDNDSYVWTTAFNYSNGQPTDVFYPSRGERGLTARILMYVATRYRNDNRFPVMLHDQAVTLKTGRIGKLSTLLKWHFEEPPTDWEIKRNNEVAARWHHNRNPFIDNPEYAARIFYYLPEPGQSSPTPAVKAVIETYGTQNETLKLDKTNVTLEVGETLQINISDNPLNEIVTWSSLDQSIVTVSSSGLLSALSVGTTKVIATGSETSAEVNVKVVPVGGEKINVTNLSFASNTETLRVGQSKTLVPTFSPNEATNKILVWNSSNHEVATVNDSGVVAALNEGSATISATTSDGSNLTASVMFTITPKNTSGASGWTLVSDTTTLSVGDELVLASKAHDATAGNLSSDVLSSTTSTFSADKSEITTLNSEAIIFTLGGAINNWTLTNPSGQKLGDSSEKKLGWDNGTTTWIIAINSSGELTMKSTSKTYTMQYNSAHPRFTTYASEQVTPQLYRYSEGATDDIRDEAYDYVSFFMEKTASECAIGNVLSSTWETLHLKYLTLSDDAKDYFYNYSEEDALIDALIDRYTVILAKYHYNNFLLSSDGDQIVFSETKDKVSNINLGVPVIIFMTSFIIFLIVPVIVKNKVH